MIHCMEMYLDPKVNHVKSVSSKCYSNFLKDISVSIFSKEMVIFELFMILYRIIMIMLRSIDFCVFGLFEVIKFRCSNTTDVRDFYIHDFHEFQEG